MDYLELGQQYNREQIHGFFGGNSTFTPSAGTWGIQGMLRTADDSLLSIQKVTNSRVFLSIICSFNILFNNNPAQIISYFVIKYLQ